MRVRIFADDLSGAADSAAAFTGACGPVALFTDDGGSRPGSFAVDLDTRAMTMVQAAGRWKELAAREPALDGDTVLFKKIDSTMRGYVQEETIAFIDARRDVERVVFTPAFPAQGRLVVDGRVVVRGERLESLAMIVARLTRRARVLSTDIARESDVAALVQAARAQPMPTLWIGSAGLARIVAGVAPNAVPAQELHAPILVVVGSASNIARAQVRAFAARYPDRVLPVEPSAISPATGRAVEEMLGKFRIVLVHLAGESRMLDRGAARSLAAALGETLRSAGTIVATGGDTARAVLETLGLAAPLVEGELEPGVAVCAPIGPREPRVVIKAGGFGDNEFFLGLK